MGSVNSIAPEMPKPALLISMSMRPSRSKTASVAAFTAVPSVTSTLMCQGSSWEGRRLNSYTVQPCARSNWAVARPMPLEPPVSMTILFICIASSGCTD